MIDKNKIAKAARQISEKVVDANGFDDSKPTHLAFLDGHIDGFNEGAKWAINELLKDLWHPDSKEPEKNHFVLFKTAGNSFETEYIGKNDWATIVRCFKVVKWFYVDDLLPKEGGEQ